jgi:inner membrane protein
MTVVTMAVCRLPNLDHDYDWLSHRGPTHTVWFALSVGVVACAEFYVGLLAAPGDLPVWPVALFAGTTVFLGSSHIYWRTR